MAISFQIPQLRALQPIYTKSQHDALLADTAQKQAASAFYAAQKLEAEAQAAERREAARQAKVVNDLMLEAVTPIPASQAIPGVSGITTAPVTPAPAQATPRPALSPQTQRPYSNLPPGVQKGLEVLEAFNPNFSNAAVARRNSVREDLKFNAERDKEMKEAQKQVLEQVQGATGWWRGLPDDQKAAGFEMLQKMYPEHFNDVRSKIELPESYSAETAPAVKSFMDYLYRSSFTNDEWVDNETARMNAETQKAAEARLAKSNSKYTGELGLFIENRPLWQELKNAENEAENRGKLLPQDVLEQQIQIAGAKTAANVRSRSDAIADSASENIAFVPYKSRAGEDRKLLPEALREFKDQPGKLELFSKYPLYVQMQAKRIGNYQAPLSELPPVSSRGTNDLQGQVVALVDQAYENLAPTSYARVKKVQDEYSRVTGSAPGNRIRAINQAVFHASQLWDAAEAFGNNKVRIINAILNPAAVNLDDVTDANLKAILTDAQALGAEMNTAFVATGGGMGEREEWRKLLGDPNASPAAIRAAITSSAKLLTGAAQSLRGSYERSLAAGTGRLLKNPHYILDIATIKDLKKIGVSEDEIMKADNYHKFLGRPPRTLRERDLMERGGVVPDVTFSQAQAEAISKARRNNPEFFKGMSDAEVGRFLGEQNSRRR